MSRRFPLVASLFLVSGMTGLLYEVAFSKVLSTIFGATAYAVSTVLAAFMGGLALGAYVGGKLGRRALHPLSTYGALEIAIGIVCAATPTAFGFLTEAYVSIARSAPESLALLTVGRAGLTALIIIIPTMAMGATLPLLSRTVAGSRGRLSLLYGINTGGGALGALSGAYLVLPALGVHGTMYAAAIADVVLGAVAIALARGAAVPAPKASEPEPKHPRATEPAPTATRGYLVLAFASGFLVFAAEVVETHLLALLIGNSAQAFGLMLAVFLVCLALGAARAAGYERRHGPRALSRSLGITAITIAVTVPLWDQLPYLFAFAGKHVSSFEGRELVRALAALAILVVPTVWMGTTFPLLLHRFAAHADVARQVGRLTTANTLGTILGAILTGYALLPWLGSERALLVVALAFGGASIATAYWDRAERPELRRAAVTMAATVVLAVALPGWNLARLTNGANVYFAYGPEPERIDFVREDIHGGVTTVAHRAGVTTMYTNGKFQGDDGPEMEAQRRFAHYPSLFLRNDDRALVIGLGTGTTLGTVASYPFEHIDVAEISPAIVEAARTFFTGPNRGSLDDPRVHMIENDGRNVILVATEPYDLITIELTSVWFAGAANLYSEEFYALVRDRLTDGGVLQQWVQLHHIHPRELAVIIRTLRTAFEHVALFEGGAQGILVASSQPLVASKARLEQHDRLDAIRATTGGRRLDELLSEMIASGPELDRLVSEQPGAAEQIVSTDDNLYLEYETPKGNVLEYHSSLQSSRALLERYRTAEPHQRHLGP